MTEHEPSKMRKFEAVYDTSTDGVDPGYDQI